MPPLSLEQVLARSMRLPSQRARQTPLSNALRGPGATRQPAASSALPSHVVHAQTLQLFERFEAEDEKRTEGRLFVHASPQMVQTSNDLLQFLRTAKRMRHWEEGLRVFAGATGVPEEVLEWRWPPADPAITSSTSVADSTWKGLVLPTSEHLCILMDACAAAGRWRSVVGVAQYYGTRCGEESLVHAVTLITREQQAPAELATILQRTGANHDQGADTENMPGWAAGLHFLAHLACPGGVLPVAAYNVVLTACENAREWQAALQVVRSMGSNPLQGWRHDEEGEETNNEAEKFAPRATAPSPDVVSYAILMAVLEQSGRERVATAVLNRLPPVEREEITASYAALIYVWSTQLYHDRRRRRQ